MDAIAVADEYRDNVKSNGARPKSVKPKVNRRRFDKRKFGRKLNATAIKSQKQLKEQNVKDATNVDEYEVCDKCEGKGYRMLLKPSVSTEIWLDHEEEKEYFQWDGCPHLSWDACKSCKWRYDCSHEAFDGICDTKCRYKREKCIRCKGEGVRPIW
jgi:hypothetical protein